MQIYESRGVFVKNRAFSLESEHKCRRSYHGMCARSTMVIVVIPQRGTNGGYKDNHGKDGKKERRGWTDTLRPWHGRVSRGGKIGT